MKRIPILLFIAISLSSCKGDKGDTGPAGPNGIDGTNGNANVKTYTFTVDPTDWADRGTPGGYNYTLIAEVPFPELTKAIMDSGLVMAYWTLQVGNDTRNYPLPYTLNYQGGSEEYGFEARTGTITFTIKDSNLNALTPSDPTDYRVVLASGMKWKELESLQYLPFSSIERQFGD